MKLKISKKSIIIASIIVAVAGTGLIYYLSTKQNGDVKAWTDSNWIYRKSLQVENTGSTVSNEDVLVTVDTATLVSNLKLQADCDDLRFVDSDDSTYLDYWIEDGCNTSSTKIWVRIPVLNSGGETIYMYYGNSSATSAQESWSGNIMMYADTTCPTGWTQASELNNKFLYGSSTYGTTGGSDTSTHSNAVCTSDSISTTSIAGTTGLTGYTIHKFTSSGTLVVSEGVTAEILVVGGGGGGGSGNGGGGGAGGVVYSSSYSLPAGSYTVTIGSGGSGGSSCGQGGNGGNTSLGSIVATGGGAGAGYSATATSGGSGGGGSDHTYYTGGSGTSGQGNSGGTGVSGGPAGGGGATGVGGNGTSGKGGNGGSGVTYSISGSSISYAGGGGGGTNAGTIGTGSAGGGNGGNSAAGGSATANTGSGGGGGGGGSCYVGGTGGSGIVIIHYNSSAKATGGTITTYNYTNNQSVSTTHTHATLTSTISSSSLLPQYENMVVCYSNQFLVSSGLISLFTSTPSTGWTRFSELDNIFARAASTYGTTGGSSTHSHTTTGATTANTEETTKSVPPTGAVGGTITYSGNYTIHTFTSGGTFFTPGGVTAEILVIGGGGGGGAGCGGGGGAGGVIYSSSYSISAGSYPITIGSGGSQGSLSGRGGNGGNTYLGDSLVAIGGGGGAGYWEASSSGGSGGGGNDHVYYSGASGTSGQGNSGGTGVTYGPGGGGGAGSVGGNGATNDSGDGGSGVTYSISGSSLGYAGGGGGGGSSSGTIGIGSSGGGNGGKGVAGVAGTANTGGGGGGGGGGADYYGGAGGSGIVIIRYLTSSTTATSSSHTHTTANSTTSSASNIPPYLTMIFAKADSSVYVNENNILMTSSVPPLGWNRFTELDSKFAMGSSTYGTTGGVATHTHTVTNTTGSPSSTTSMRNYGSFYFADSTHTHSCTVTTQSASSLPSYYSVIYMQRKISKVVTMGLEETENAVPNTPSSLLTEGLTNPTGILDLTPEFSAIFSDSDATDTGNYYQIQVNTASDFTGTSMWDSTKTAFGTPIVNGNRSSDISYAGTSLSYGTTYYWRIKFWDNNETFNESSWSSTAQFTINYIPNQPSSLLTEGQTNPSKTSLSPYFSAIFTDNDTSDTATYYQILVNSSSDFTGTSMWDSTKTAFGTPIVNGNRSSDISYAGSALENGTTYFWKIKFWDNNDLEGTYSETATFTTTGVPSAPTGLLTNGQTNPTIVNDYTPYFSAIYSDINGDNASYYEIEINTNSSFTGTVIWDTDKTSTNITSGSRSPNYESASLGNIETTYYWRIRFWDTDDNVSEWSSTASFTTSSTHFRFEGLKMEGIKLN